jgi:F-type H+-transporting ATPase subunit b
VTHAAQSQIEAERQSAVVSLRREVGTLAIDLASGVVGEQLSNDQKASALVDRFLAELEASEKAAN